MRDDCLLILNVLMGLLLSFMALMPYWVSQYVPIPMAYHYYPLALGFGIYSTYHFSNSIFYLVCFLLCSLVSVVTTSIFYNEVVGAGPTYVLGQRNYSHIAGSLTSLNITTVNSDGTYSDAMSVLDTCTVTFAFCMVFLNLWSAFLLISLKKYSKCETSEVKLRQMHTRDWISVFSTLGVMIVIYYIVASIIMVTDSVVLISPISSPNTLSVFLIGICVRLPRLREDEIRPTPCCSSKSIFVHFVTVAWLLATAFCISSMVMIINWRAVQDNYTTRTSMCPSREIISALNANYTFTFPWDGIDELTYSNRSTWTPETFADFTCADDAINFTMSVYSFIMFLMMSVYMCYWYRDAYGDKEDERRLIPPSVP
jgi:hypothetical protein